MDHDVIEIRGSLLFDSWFEEAPLVRNSAGEDRHLIYEGGGVILDLLVKQSHGSACLHVGGQVLSDGESVGNVANLPIKIESREGQTETRTNPIGEFMFHTPTEGAFDLTILLRDQRFVVRGLAGNEPRQWQLAHTMDGRA